MSHKDTQMRIDLQEFWRAAEREMRELSCTLPTVRKVIEANLRQGLNMLETLRCCQSELSKADHPVLRAMIDQAIRNCIE